MNALASGQSLGGLRAWAAVLWRRGSHDEARKTVDAALAALTGAEADVVRAYLLAAESGLSGEVLNIGSGGTS